MSAENLNNYPVESPPVPERPPFDLLKGSVEVSEVPTEIAWPHYTFDLSKQNIFGSLNLATNDHARTQEVLRAMSKTAPEVLPAVDLQELEQKRHKKFTYFEGLEEQSKKIRNYMTGGITVREEKLPRIALIKQSEVFNEIWRDLRAVNHPLIQVVKQVIRENLNREKANKSLPERMHKPTLSKNQIIGLMDDLLITTHGEDIKSGFEKRISALRQTEN